ncbi:hypothetical protein ACFL21_03750 [Patescibacteria group bacterium]
MGKSLKRKIAKILLVTIICAFSLNIFVGVKLAYAAELKDEQCYTDTTYATLDTTHEVKDGACVPISTTPDAKTGAFDEKLSGIAAFIITMQRFLNKLLWPVLIMIGGLLDNSILFGSGMEERMRDIWIPIRNLVNLLFVVALVGVALYNVLGLGDENSTYSLKAILPKIVIGIIAVNFSFIAFKVMLDAINMLTVSIFTLPDQVGGGLSEIIAEGKAGEIQEKRLCASLQDVSVSDLGENTNIELAAKDKRNAHCNAAHDMQYTSVKCDWKITLMENEIKAKVPEGTDAEAEIKLWKDRSAANERNNICLGGDKLTPTGKVFLSKYGSQNAALALALNMGKVIYFEDIPTDAELKHNIENLVVGSLFSVVLYLVYIIAFVVLFIVLLARLVILWLGLVLSPILLLGFAVPELRDKISVLGELQEQFVANAVAPIGIALSMSIGWIMLKAMENYNAVSTDLVAFNSSQVGFPVQSLDTIQSIIVALATVVVVWMGVFAAASKSVAKGVTDTMKTTLQGFGSWVAKAPLKYAPVLPIYDPKTNEWKTGKEGASLAAIPHTIRELQSRTSPQQKALSNMLFGDETRTPGTLSSFNKAAEDRNLKQMAEDLKTLNLTDKANLKALQDLKNNNPNTYNDFYGSLNPEGRSALDKLTDENTANSAIQGHQTDLRNDLNRIDTSALSTGTATDTAAGGGDASAPADDTSSSGRSSSAPDEQAAPTTTYNFTSGGNNIEINDKNPDHYSAITATGDLKDPAKLGAANDIDIMNDIKAITDTVGPVERDSFQREITEANVTTIETTLANSTDPTITALGGTGAERLDGLLSQPATANP